MPSLPTLGFEGRVFLEDLAHVCDADPLGRGDLWARVSFCSPVSDDARWWGKVTHTGLYGKLVGYHSYGIGLPNDYLVVSTSFAQSRADRYLLPDTDHCLALLGSPLLCFCVVLILVVSRTCVISSVREPALGIVARLVFEHV